MLKLILIIYTHINIWMIKKPKINVIKQSVPGCCTKLLLSYIWKSLRACSNYQLKLILVEYRPLFKVKISC